MTDREPAPLPEPLPVPTVDAHTHLDACGVSGPDEVRTALDRAESVGVSRVVTVADDLDSAHWAATAAGWDPRLWAAVALHPTRAQHLDDDARTALERLAREPRVVSVGETGLDHYWTHARPDTTATPAQQEEAFRWHIDLAKRVGKPLMIHDRDAHDDVLRILDSEGAPDTVVFHCFSGDLAVARRCLDAGYVLSFSGTVTFRNARELRAAAVETPDGSFLVETDAPFLTPHPHRGRSNHPSALPFTVRGLAELRGQDVAHVATSAADTAERVFGFR